MGSDLRKQVIRVAAQLPRGSEGRRALLAVLKGASKRTQVTSDLKLKDGTVYPRGTEATVHFSERTPWVAEVEIEGRTIKLRTPGLHKHFKGFAKPPSQRVLERMVDDGVATTVTGERRVEPDGYGRDGSPSWLLALGYI